MQAISGAGYPGVASLDILDNVVPYIGGEEEKIEWETLKILGGVQASDEGVSVYDMHARHPLRAARSAIASPSSTATRNASPRLDERTAASVVFVVEEEKSEYTKSPSGRSRASTAGGYFQDGARGRGREGRGSAREQCAAQDASVNLVARMSARERAFVAPRAAR
ncbi:hypothetical protein EV122DRAFT_285228 [Schizophyllum commune]